MKKTVLISITTASFLLANDLGTIDVSEELLSQKVENVSSEELKSADLAEALSKSSSSVNLIRRSGIANDILVRSQKKDNISVIIDDAKVCGACPNRMDPPTSHIVTNSVEEVEIIGGPFDVENMGTLSGHVRIKTKDPKEELSGDINLNVGSFDYQKTSASVSGGNEKFRLLVGASYENSEQYEDGSGQTMAEQLNSQASAAGPKYTNSTSTMDSFTKKTGNIKLFINPTDNSELRVSYTANRSDDILYPSSMMDAIYDDSDIYSFGATFKDIAKYSDAIKFETYRSKVKHLMSNRYRNAGAVAGGYMDAYVESIMQGAKLKNSFSIDNSSFDIGLDTSKRNWDGQKYNSLTGFAPATTDANFIPDVDTKNKAIFAKSSTQINDTNIALGLRYDDTNVKANKIAKSMSATARNDIDYNSLSANIMATQRLNDDWQTFVGIGTSARVPDAKELFMGNTGVVDGDVNQTKNREIDFGFDYSDGIKGAKTKLFYSDLKDYIYYHSDNGKYVNIDAKIYGFEFAGFYYLSDELSFDLMASWQKGKKKEPLSGQSDTNLADIVPLKTNLGLSYEVSKHHLRAELIAAKSWSKFDSDNGERRLAGYGVVNAKYNYNISKNFDITFGIDNIMDKTYAVSNTYQDLTLAGTSDGIMLLNEMGRYTYANLRVKF